MTIPIRKGRGTMPCQLSSRAIQCCQLLSIVAKVHDEVILGAQLNFNRETSRVVPGLCGKGKKNSQAKKKLGRTRKSSLFSRKHQSHLHHPQFIFLSYKDSFPGIKSYSSKKPPVLSFLAPFTPVFNPRELFLFYRRAFGALIPSDAS